MLNYYLYNLNDPITLIALLTGRLPKYRHIPAKKHNFIITDPSADVNGNTFYGLSNSSDIRKWLKSVVKNIQDIVHFSNKQLQSAKSNHINKLSLTVIVANNHIYIIKPTYHSDDDYVISYRYNKKLLNQIFINILHKLSNQYIGKYTKSLERLKDLWVIQSKRSEITPHDYKSLDDIALKLPKGFRELFTSLIIDITHYKSNPLVHIKYEDVVRFYHEVHNGHLTPKTRRVQDWILQNSQDRSSTAKALKVLQLMKFYDSYDNVIHGIKEVPLSKVSTLIHTLKKDKISHRKYFHFKLDRIFEPTYKQRQIKGKHHFVGVHGTNSYSIPTILTCGLEAPDELRKHHLKNYEYIGNSLGTGTYLSHVSQFTKSLNYSNNNSNSKYKWLFVVDVAYNHPIKEDHYQAPKKKYDFVFGSAVGFAHNYSEFVARHGDQMKIKYILRFRRLNRHKHNH